MTLTKTEIDQIKAALERAKSCHTEENSHPVELSRQCPSHSWKQQNPQPSSRKDGAAKLICNEGGKPISCLANAVSILRGFDPRWLGVLAYDQFSSAIVTRKSPPWGAIVGPWTSSDDVRAADYLNHVGIFVSSKVAAQAADIAARDGGFHPVREFLRSLKWDRTPRLDNWLSTYLGAEASAWTKAAGSRWLISGVARAMKPGCQADYLLLLVGPQGAMKSSALQILAGDGWFRDHAFPRLHPKIVESNCKAGGLLNSENWRRNGTRLHEAMKSFFTCRIDSFPDRFTALAWWTIQGRPYFQRAQTVGTHLATQRETDDTGRFQSGRSILRRCERIARSYGPKRLPDFSRGNHGGSPRRN